MTCPTTVVLFLLMVCSSDQCFWIKRICDASLIDSAQLACDAVLVFLINKCGSVLGSHGHTDEYLTFRFVPSEQQMPQRRH